MSKLRHQLMISYLPLILVPVLVVGLVTRNAAEQGFTLFVTQGARRESHILAQCFARYYETHGSWEGVSSLWEVRNQPDLALSNDAANNSPSRPGVPVFDANMNCLLPDPSGQASGPSSDPENPEAQQLQQWMALKYFWSSFGADPKNGAILITDVNGTVVGSSNPSNIGQPLSVNVLSQGSPIVVGNRAVGILVVGAMLDFLDAQQRQLLDTVNLSLLLSGVLSVVLAVGIGLWFSWQVTSPMRHLMEGVRRLSTGEWSKPLKVRSKNEFGELTHSFNSMANEVTRQQQLSRQMVADIAHDLRTPLSAMALEVEAIEAGFQTPEEATASLREEITWLQRLVDDLRTLSLMDADQLHLQVDQIPLKSFLAGLVDFWQTMADEEHRILTLDVPDTLSTVWIDPNRMRQVIGNLIDNAIRHTKSGGHISIGAQSEGERIRIWVKDDGEGIAAADLPHVFDRFYRGDRSRGHSNSGSGLGLSISRRFVEMHGGTIDVKSTLGQGTTFTIQLKNAPPPPPEKRLRLVDGRQSSQTV